MTVLMYSKAATATSDTHQMLSCQGSANSDFGRNIEMQISEVFSGTVTGPRSPPYDFQTPVRRKVKRTTTGDDLDQPKS